MIYRFFKLTIIYSAITLVLVFFITGGTGYDDIPFWVLGMIYLQQAHFFWPYIAVGLRSKHCRGKIGAILVSVIVIASIFIAAFAFLVSFLK